MPRHEWLFTSLRFEQSRDVWGNWVNLKGVQGDQGAQGNRGYQGYQGNIGNFGGVSLNYKFTNSTMSVASGYFALYDPETGHSQNSFDQIHISDYDSNNLDVQAFLRTLDDSTSTIKGMVRISSKTESSKFIIANITGITEYAGKFIIDSSIISGSSTSPFTTNEECILSFSETGDKGDQGTQGNRGYQGYQGNQGYQGANGDSMFEIISGKIYSKTPFNLVLGSTSASQESTLLPRVSGYKNIGSEQWKWANVYADKYLCYNEIIMMSGATIKFIMDLSGDDLIYRNASGDTKQKFHQDGDATFFYVAPVTES